MEVLEHDITIIGAGLAGLRAAIAAAELNKNIDVAVVSKVYPVRSHSVCAEGGTNAVLKKDDSYDLHAWDTIKGSDFLADQNIVEFMIKKAPQEIVNLEHWGCPWSRDKDGKIAQRAGGGQSFPRVCFAADVAGLQEMHTLYAKTSTYENVEFYNEWFVTSILVEDNVVRGLTAMELKTGELFCIKSKAVIIATGGYARIYAFTTFSHTATGDGAAMAYRVGAPLKDMEFVQFHPTGLVPSGILITESARGEGGYLINAKGERFMKNYAPEKMELAPRDVVARAETREILEGKGFASPHGSYIGLDLRHLGEDRINERLPLIRDIARKLVGVDPAKEPLPVRPAAHYTMGGIHVNIKTETPISGLYAAGECSCLSVHGANRLGGNSTTDCLVFGGVAGEEAAKYVSSNSFRELPNRKILDEEKRIFDKILGKNGDEKVSTIRDAMRKVMNENVWIFRTKDGLQVALKEIKQLRERFKNIKIEDKTKTFNTQLIEALQLDFMLDLAEVTVMSALARTESRGAHCRLDYPERDDEKWLVHTLAYYTREGPRLEYQPVTITRWSPIERKY